jgi:hypothetical protein
LIDPIADAEFSASAREEPGRLVLTFLGGTELDTRPLLERFLLGVHDEVCLRAVPEVVVDLRATAFINSACLKVMAGWIVTATTKTRIRYRISFQSSREHLWQRRSLAALASIAPDLVSVSTQGS